MSSPRIIGTGRFFENTGKSAPEPHAIFWDKDDKQWLEVKTVFLDTLEVEECEPPR